ncbi:hypothetical protein HK100_009605, partial [Physocladia obscura]
MSGSHSMAGVGSKSLAGVMASGASFENSQDRGVHVIDEDGNDVTPQTLITGSKSRYKHPMMQGMEMLS